MPPTDTLRPDTSAFLDQQATILMDAPDNDTMVRHLLAAALRRISELEQQLVAATQAGRPRPQPSLRHPILRLLQAQPDGLTRPQIEEALEQRELCDTLQRMIRDALLVRTGDHYRLASTGQDGQAPAETAPPPAPAAPPAAPPPAPRKRGGRPRTRG
jgi:hypothetical protein